MEQTKSTAGTEVSSFDQTLGLSPLLARTQRSALHVRCECAVCGAHSYAQPDHLDTERCGNCLSTNLSPIEEVASPPTRWGFPRGEVQVSRQAGAKVL